MIRRFGYDFERGRQDKTHHPFMTKFSLGDVRITTRVRENDLTDALFSTLHEAGHAMYEQGIRHGVRGHAARERHLVRRPREPVAPVGEPGRPQPRRSGSTSIRGCRRRSRRSSRDVPLDTFYRAINKVERSLIRTDADEVTYNLHVMLRFDLELDLLEGRLAVKDLPEAWRARFQSDLGIPVPDDKDGVLQDVHWYAGTIGGAFQGYTLGNILSAQFFAAAVQRASVDLRRDRAAASSPRCTAGCARTSTARREVHGRRADRARHRWADVDRAVPRVPVEQVPATLRSRGRAGRRGVNTISTSTSHSRSVP